uniref:Uncharacterized protein n=1 Tax=Odontella aurita TaxID=265563 RepID=A0A7S4N3P2_9STRA|mmetsp:Transcript_45900/g.139396  ORF Transcript_45900/g.139396 Transcript_45900/m.139396 type:complete len:142 (+) Transcript_45900:286-711(+)
MRQYVMKQTSPPFTMLCDTKFVAYTRYHVKCSKAGLLMGLCRAKMNGSLKKAAAKGFGGLGGGPVDGRIDRMPADFLIDEEGKIADVFRAKFADEHMPWKRIEAFIPKGRACRCSRSNCVSESCRRKHEEVKQSFGEIFIG